MTILECSGLTKKYGSITALDNISLNIEPGKIVGLLGPNGSGKSTFIKLCNGLLRPSSGTLTIDGYAPGPETKKIVSYLPERTYFEDWMTTEQAIKLFEDFYEDFDRERAEKMLASLEIGMKTHIRQMSKGTREKLQLILVMSRRARLYLLDEPIGGVDPAARDYILHTIISNYSPSASVLITTHLIADVESILDEVIFINRGRIQLQTTTDEIRSKMGMTVDAYFREVFRCSANY